MNREDEPLIVGKEINIKVYEINLPILDFQVTCRSHSMKLQKITRFMPAMFKSLSQQLYLNNRVEEF